jgi:hypothetical protein
MASFCFLLEALTILASWEYFRMNIPEGRGYLAAAKAK